MRTRYTKVYTHCVPPIEIFVKKVTSITIINDDNDENNNNDTITMVVMSANTCEPTASVRGPEAG